MKDAEFNAMELRRSLMDIERACETIAHNIGVVPGSRADLKKFATHAVRTLEKMAHDALRKRPDKNSERAE